MSTNGCDSCRKAFHCSDAWPNENCKTGKFSLSVDRWADHWEGLFRRRKAGVVDGLPGRRYVKGERAEAVVV